MGCTHAHMVCETSNLCFISFSRPSFKSFLSTAKLFIFCLSLFNFFLHGLNMSGDLRKLVTGPFCLDFSEQDIFISSSSLFLNFYGLILKIHLCCFPSRFWSLHIVHLILQISVMTPDFELPKNVWCCCFAFFITYEPYLWIICNQTNTVKLIIYRWWLVLVILHRQCKKFLRKFLRMWFPSQSGNLCVEKLPCKRQLQEVIKGWYWNMQAENKMRFYVVEFSLFSCLLTRRFKEPMLHWSKKTKTTRLIPENGSSRIPLEKI